MADLFKAVRDAVPIERAYEDLTGHTVPRGKREARVRCPAPAHDDKTPDCDLNIEKGVWHCKACGEAGNVIGMAAGVRGCEVHEAAKWLAERYGVDYDDAQDPEAAAERQARHQAEEVRRHLLRHYIYWCHTKLTDEHRELIHDRGISDNTIDRLRIGFDPRSGSDKPQRARRLGLLGGKDHDAYIPSGRIIIPVYEYDDPERDVIYWVAWDWTMSGPKKYLFPKGPEDDPRFGVKQPLVGHVPARPRGECYLVEGVFDFLSLREAGLDARCSLGLGLSQGKAKALPAGIRILFDNDLKDDGSNPGQEAAEKLAEEMWPRKAQIVKLPDGQDPNDLWLAVGCDEDAFRRQLGELPRDTIFDRRLQAVERAEDDAARVEAAKALYPLAARTTTSTDREAAVSAVYEAQGGRSGPLRKTAIREDVESLVDKQRKQADGADMPGDDDDDTNQSARLVDMALSAGCELFHDDVGEPYARVPIEEGHREIWRVGSDAFRRWLSRLYYNLTESDVPSAQSVRNACGVLEGRAVFDGDRHQLHNRVAAHDSAIWVDLSNGDWQAVRVDPDGWKVVDDTPILFRRHGHQAPQVTPQKGGDIHRVFDVINLPAPEGDEIDDRSLLYLVWLVTAWVPDIPHPAPAVHGDKGSAKTWLSRISRDIIDPSQIKEGLTLPREDAELAQQLDHHYMPVYDNLGTLPKWVSDTFCRAITGGGFTKRKLYTDAQDVVFQFKRVITFNGINLAATEADLLDRSLILSLTHIPEEERMTENALQDLWEDVRPTVVGGLLDALSGAMARIGSVELSRLPRMADFARWGFAAAEALGYSGEQFIRAYFESIGAQVDAALEAHPLGQAILIFMDEREAWKGRSSELYEHLNNIADDTPGLNPNAKAWPGDVRWLTRRMNEIKSTLRGAGITAEQYRSSKGNGWLLTKKVEGDPQAQEAVPHQPSGGEGGAGDEVDLDLGTIEGLLNAVDVIDTNYADEEDKAQLREHIRSEHRIPDLDDRLTSILGERGAAALWIAPRRHMEAVREAILELNEQKPGG